MTSLLAMEGLRQRIRRHLGLHLEGRDRTLEALLAERVRASGSPDPAGYLQLLDDPTRAPAELRVLSDRLAVGESYFFRNVEQLEQLIDWVGGQAGRTRVLSAGSAAGEEAYSLAILAEEAGLADRLDLTAVDASDQLLAAARLGRYSRWGLRATPDRVRDRWFTRTDEGWELDASIRRRVRFQRVDLVSPEAGSLFGTGTWDAILCRNVIIYLTHEATQTLVGRLVTALRPGGLLFLGYAESLLRRPASLELVHTPGSFHYRRRETGATVPAAEVEANWWEVIADSTERVAARVKAPGRAPADAPVTSVRESVLRSLRAERFAEALAQIEAAPEKARSRGDVALLEAAVRFDLNQIDDSVSLCRRALDEYGPNADLHYLLAKGLDLQGHAVASLGHAEMAARLDPGFSLPHMYAGRLCRALGDTEGAVAALRRAEELLPEESDERLLILAAGFGRGALLGLVRRELGILEVRR